MMMNRYFKILAPFLISALFFFLTFFSIKNYSYTTDEPSHLVRGVMLLRTGDYRINQHHPILFNILHSIPNALNKSFNIANLEGDNWKYAKKDDLAFELVDINGGREKYSLEYLADSRLIASSLSALMLLTMFFVLKKLFGYTKSIIAVTLLAFSPSLIAHAGLVTTDVPAMFTIFFATIALYWDLKKLRENPKRIPFLFILTSTIAVITKYTATLLFPFWILIFLYVLWINKTYSARELIFKTIMVVFSVFILVWGAYGFRVGTIISADYNNQEKIAATIDHLQTIERHVPIANFDLLEEIYAKVVLPFPEYIKGFYDNVVKHNFHGHRTYLLGQPNNGGNPIYFPVAFTIKETIPFLFLSIFSVIYLVLLINKRLFKPDRTYLLPIIVIPTILVVMSLSSSINIGVRHILPIYPFLVLGMSFVITKVISSFQRPLLIKYAVAGLFVAHILLTSLHFPIYLGYFNELVGDDKYNYLYLQDSNFDWRHENHLQERFERENTDSALIVYPKESLSTNINKLEKWQLCLRYKFFSDEISPEKELGNNFYIFRIEDKEKLCRF